MMTAPCRRWTDQCASLFVLHLGAALQRVEESGEHLGSPGEEGDEGRSELAAQGAPENSEAVASVPERQGAAG